MNQTVVPLREVSSSLQYVVIYKETQLLCCGRGHTAFDVEDELSEIVASSRFSGRRFDGRDKENKPANFAASATTSTVGATLGLVLSGRYLGYLPRHACKPSIERVEIWPLRPKIHSFGTDIKIVHHEASHCFSSSR